MPVQDYSPSIAAGGQQRVTVSGRYVRVMSADASGVTIKPNTGPPLLRYQGQQIDTGPLGFQFLDVSVSVTSTPRLAISDQPQDDSNTNVSATVSATVTPGGTIGNGGDVACPNAAATPVLAANANRLAGIVNAPAAGTWATGTVRVGTTGLTATGGIEINPGDSITIADTAAIVVYNNSGSSVTLQALEVNK